MNQAVDIAELVKPKFKPGQDVWAVIREYNNRISHIRPVRIDSIDYLVNISVDKHGTEHRQTALLYRTPRGEEMAEETLFSSLDDIPAEDRAPRVG
ncbi:hypothetical protein [Burkholderia multivorans]|uniref:hypothetical protein n=1 Tax=Burkholderia multivorans TaxID=87883 RepID=UPI001C250F87|nr:hypothetical protein [Burkholderia multivorans]MBU9386610.1 hypothetical protein [Burkholderia multivorans]MBU9437044.1 hypothetical protein [Burkholderia multivorans]MBU9606249.1 hypothetical protein [Burkholderia multivorans]MBU9624808.1 hypothetical protein [Burkholderia multivorans]MDN7510953.1 hypothetical protein [Burkholderia multivorans]